MELYANNAYLALINQNIKGMKTKIKALSILLFSLFLTVGFISCSDDTDPADQKVFADTYKGKISYISIADKKNISADDGKVLVTKLGNTYSFKFDNGIPDLNNIKFEDKGDNTYVSIGSSGLNGITITASKLTMLVVKDGKTWTANCSR